MGGWTSQIRKIQNDPSYVLSTVVSREFDLRPEGIKWLYSSNLLKYEMTMHTLSNNGPVRSVDYMQLTPYGEEVLDELEKGTEVELYLD